MSQEIVLTREGLIKVIVQKEKEEDSYILPENRALRVLKSNQISLERGFSLRSYFSQSYKIYSWHQGHLITHNISKVI